MGQALAIEFPRDVDPGALEPLLLRLRALLVPHSALGRPSRAALELAADASGVGIGLWLERADLAPAASQALRAAFPRGRITERSRDPVESFAAFSRLSLGRSDASLRSDLGEAALGGMLSPLSELRGEQRALVQLTLAPAPAAAQGRLLARASRQERRGTDSSLVAGLGRLEANRPRARATREKAATPLFRTSVLVAGTDAFLVRDVATGFAQFAAPYAQVRHHRVYWLARARAQLTRRALPLWPAPTLVGARELAALLAPSSGALTAARGPILRSRRLAVPSGVPTRGRVLCVGEAGGRSRTVAISRADSRSHLALIGPTNTGKTTAQVNFFLQAVRSGDGGVFIEPAKGDAIEAVLRRLPESERERVVVVDPERERGHPPGFNLLEPSAGEEAGEAAGAILAVLRDLYERSWGARTDDTAYNGLVTAAALPGTTIAELPALYASARFRRPYLAALRDPFVRDWWAWFERLSDAERAQITAPVLNKLRPLLRPSLLPIVGQRQSTIRLDAILRERQILLLRLPVGGELFGALLVAALWRAVERRASTPEHRRPDVVLCIDEVHRFLRTGGDVGEMLALARGLRLSLCLATQHLEQCPPALRAALLHNARSRVVFQTSYPDATTLARTFAPELEAVDLANLARFEVAARVAVDGAVSAPFTGRTLPLPEPMHASSEPIRAGSRRRYGRPRAAVYSEIRERLAAANQGGELSAEAIGSAPI
ncbi:MAG: hypothetical protein JOZ25_12100 [Actinobacteria bacterium]|nr:hypothetical protein [Actinomycetota bacterium]